MNRQLIFALALALFAPAVSDAATAGSWYLWCDSNRAAINGLRPGDWGCWDAAANSDSSPIISVGSCENLDIYNFSDKTGGGTASTVAFTAQVCPSSSSTLNNDTKRGNACETMADTTAISANDGISGAPTIPYLRLTGDSAGSNPTSARIVVKCNP